ncbi:MAG TPA: SBBP repeat-containing protein, partial [Candidatus Goldiibacteriota bacterium]|nr:SBBP repeat-containing protein [Candidatus Goldiibacteriota bacterium]
SGVFITKWGSYGNADGQFSYPYGVAVDSAGNVYVADYNNDRIQKFTSSGVFITKWGSYGNADGQFNSPRGVAVDSAGNVYVADSGNNRVQKFAPQ